MAGTTGELRAENLQFEHTIVRYDKLDTLNLVFSLYRRWLEN